VAGGAARQAAWVLSGAAEPPAWASDEGAHVSAPATPEVREQYAAVRDMTIR
jgi:xylulokinase